MHKNIFSIRAFVTGCALALAFFAGWQGRAYRAKTPVAASELARIDLRKGGYSFINPLLACNIKEASGVREARDLSNRIAEYVRKETAAGAVITASAYFRSLPSGIWANVNDQEKYYPASLSKVPVMMAYFKLAEKNPDLLSEKMLFRGSESLSAQEIQPRERLAVGESYTVRELIRRMIVSSDNDAFWLLADRLDPSYVAEIFSDLGIPHAKEESALPNDYITVRSYSLFFRVLYNATYTTWNFSEEALKNLSGVDFKDGLVKGVPAQVTVAHKYGLFALPEGGGTTLRELHDCGIVYVPGNPYLICVMTKTRAGLKDAERVIQNISKMAYEFAAAQTVE